MIKKTKLAYRKFVKKWIFNPNQMKALVSKVKAMSTEEKRKGNDSGGGQDRNYRQAKKHSFLLWFWFTLQHIKAHFNLKLMH